ncbi:helix-turn-helix transcriptional regulator [Noviherbaspirillum sp.]|uniref:helix-turn-helix transcriptional regulator n=1 Tax=Noviherbaspirillum sp. TaxID=1926288 RepID=UPI002FE310F0
MSLDTLSSQGSVPNSDGPPQAGRVIVRAKDMRKITGIPNSTRADKENPKSPRFDPTWPKKIRLGLRSTGYFLDEVLAWLEKQRKG